jgi:hypothetical protein
VNVHCTMPTRACCLCGVAKLIHMHKFAHLVAFAGAMFYMYTCSVSVFVQSGLLAG